MNAGAQALGFLGGLALGFLSFWVIYKAVKPSLVNRAAFELNTRARADATIGPALNTPAGGALLSVADAALRETLRKELP